MSVSFLVVFFFFNDTATTEIYTLSLHDALPIGPPPEVRVPEAGRRADRRVRRPDRKSTRLNSSHRCISYAVFCLKKKKTIYAYIELTKKKKQIPRKKPNQPHS